MASVLGSLYPGSVRNVAGVAHGEQALLVHTMVILFDHDDYVRQIRPRLEDALALWSISPLAGRAEDSA